MKETQLQLTGTFERDKALEAIRKKYKTWLDMIGTPTLYQLCKEKEFFTTDDLWEKFNTIPHYIERRVMGALIRGFALKGHIEKTGITEPSRLAICHARDKTLWKSKIYNK